MKLIQRALIATIILFFSASNLIESLPNFKFTFPGGSGFTFSFALILFNFVLLVYAIIQYFVIFGELLSRKIAGKTETNENIEGLGCQENEELTAFDEIKPTMEITKEDISTLTEGPIRVILIIIGVLVGAYFSVEILVYFFGEPK